MLTQLKLLTYALLLLSTQLMANEFHTINQQRLKQASQLPQLAQQYFTEVNQGFEPGPSLDDMLDVKRQNLFFRMRRALSMAVDSHSDISALEAYGITKLDERAYRIEYTKHPQWAGIDTLFNYLAIPVRFQSSEYRLRNMGLSSDDIKLLAKYLDDNDIYLLNFQHELRLAQKYQKLLLQEHNSGAKLLISNKFLVASRKAKHDNWFQWLKGLMANFSRVKQLTIYECGKQQLGEVHMSGTIKTEKSMQYFTSQIEQGKTAEALQSVIERARQKTLWGGSKGVKS